MSAKRLPKAQCLPRVSRPRRPRGGSRASKHGTSLHSGSWTAPAQRAAVRVASFSPKITESPEYIKAPCKATSQSQLAWKSCCLPARCIGKRSFSLAECLAPPGACGESQEATEVGSFQVWMRFFADVGPGYAWMLSALDRCVIACGPAGDRSGPVLASSSAAELNLSFSSSKRDFLHVFTTKKSKASPLVIAQARAAAAGGQGGPTWAGVDTGLATCHIRVQVSKARFQACKTELEARAKQVGREARLCFAPQLRFPPGSSPSLQARSHES